VPGHDPAGDPGRRPPTIGGALLAAGVGCIAASAATLLVPTYWAAVRPVATLLMAGALPMIVWLIGWGAREPNAAPRAVTHSRQEKAR
jgi:hypothetical protein